VIATSSVGALGWFSGRRILDTDGIISLRTAKLKQQFGPEQGVWISFLESRPSYLIAFGDDHASLIAKAVPTGFLMPLGHRIALTEDSAPNSAPITMPEGVRIYRFDYSRLAAADTAQRLRSK
jgi:hypothetical protein